ncbi:hypothetical protein NDU88_001959 [Pleurodeles waltl]|uniref:Uncharacterized protein n=1 Tax=Pleurodeles waltl TaxID=8319 RepID=A0AAV7S8V8_PLEWA|nr:hypothetical protein NDU88_001959 [Pleurodeles waltl]
MTDELIRDQLIVQCRDKKIQERLWAAKNPTLQEVIDLAKVMDESKRCIKELERKEKTVEVMALSNDPTILQPETGVIKKKNMFVGSKGRECFSDHSIVSDAGMSIEEGTTSGVSHGTASEAGRSDEEGITDEDGTTSGVNHGTASEAGESKSQNTSVTQDRENSQTKGVVRGQLMRNRKCPSYFKDYILE